MKIINYIKNDAFSFRFINNKLNVVNYKEIKIIHDDLITLTYDNNKEFKIHGQNLILKKMILHELLIEGIITSIEL